MDSCRTVLPGDEVRLSLPAAAAYLPVLLAAAESMAVLAGFGPRAAGRARLVTEEVFSHVAEQCWRGGQRQAVDVGLRAEADGLILRFSTPIISFDPESLPDYSIEDLLGSGGAEGLGLHLVRAYARDMTLTRKGSSRELRLTLARQQEDVGSRPWHRIVPSLSPGITLRPMSHQGRLVHRLEHAGSGKTFIVRDLAREVLALIDGRRSFGAIMGHVGKVMPEKGRQEVEDLFEALIGRGLVSIETTPLPQAELKVRDEIEPGHLRAMDAYHKAGPDKL